MKSHEVVKAAITATGLAIAGTALAACATKPPAPYSSEYPDWVNDSDTKNACDITLTSGDLDSLQKVKDVVNKLDPDDSRKGFLIKGAYDPHEGQVVNLSVANPYTSQAAGDIAILGNVKQSVCVSPRLNGKYVPTPKEPISSPS